MSRSKPPKYCVKVIMELKIMKSRLKDDASPKYIIFLNSMWLACPVSLVVFGQVFALRKTLGKWSA